MKLTWKGHACFVLENNGYQLILDPYREVPGLEDISGKVNEVLCSHGHFDHNHTGQLTVTGGTSPFTCVKVPCFHDDAEGSLRGQNIIHCLTAEGLRVVHLGDLGHLLSEDQIKPLSGCDVLLIPVGGTYTLDSAQAKQVVEQIQPRIIIPMHYRKGEIGFPVLEPVENFLSHFDPQTVRRYDAPDFELTADTPAQLALLSL